MVLAQVMAWIGIAASCISGVVMMTSDYMSPLIGLLVMVLGSLLSWVGSFMTYGFGQLIENTEILVVQGRQANAKLVRPPESGGNSGVNPGANPGSSREDTTKKPSLEKPEETFDDTSEHLVEKPKITDEEIANVSKLFERHEK